MDIVSIKSKSMHLNPKIHTPDHTCRTSGGQTQG